MQWIFLKQLYFRFYFLFYILYLFSQELLLSFEISQSFCYRHYKRDITKHELRVESLKVKVRVEIQRYKFRYTSYEFKSTTSNSTVTSSTLRVKSTSYEFKSTSYELKFTNYEFPSTSYEFKFTNYEFKSTSSRIIESMTNKVNSLRISLFPKTLIFKSFGNLWDNSCVQFLVIISCFSPHYFIGTTSAGNKVSTVKWVLRLNFWTEKLPFTPDFGEDFH